jgi:PIN domain nuclease of toxin-antitoxin system
VKVLLDTHAWVWAEEDDASLGPHTRKQLLRAETGIFVSAISTLELAQLMFRGRITLRSPVTQWVRISLENLKAESLELSHEIAAAAYSLPGEIHGDPADRILIATARLLKLTLITADTRILEYPHVTALNARR